jgi:hypothetical protein
MAGGESPAFSLGETFMKKKTKKLVLAKETLAVLLSHAPGGISATCAPTWFCSTMCTQDPNCWTREQPC